MRLSDGAQAALDKVVEQFKSGDLSPIVEIARIQRNGDAIPSDRWTLSNRVLAYVQSGCMDCRGYRQWQEVGRHVKRGSRAVYILAPILVKVKNEDGEEVEVLKGFRSIPVFASHDTEGEELPEADCSPRDLPPLADVAERMGIDVSYVPLPLDRLGTCSLEGSRIKLGTHDVEVFFHELAHAAHAKVEGRLKRGQNPHQETVAQFTACVLMELYGRGDRTGNSWEYIRNYAKDPLRAIVKALRKVEEVLG
jgi:hypothetical protein